MYARMTYSQVAVDKIDEALSIWKNKVGPSLKQTKGFKGAYVTGDRATGKGLTITLWETKADADATQATVPQFLALFEGVFSGPPSVDSFEVLLQV